MKTELTTAVVTNCSIWTDLQNEGFNKSKIVSLMSVAALLASLLLVCDSHYSFISIASAHQKHTSEKEVAVPSCHEVSSEDTKTETQPDRMPSMRCRHLPAVHGLFAAN